MKWYSYDIEIIIVEFVHFLKARMTKQVLDITIASESSLEKEWLKPEEDEAWQNL